MKISAHVLFLALTVSTKAVNGASNNSTILIGPRDIFVNDAFYSDFSSANFANRSMTTELLDSEVPEIFKALPSFGLVSMVP